MAAADVCRRHSVSSATFYKWESKYGGLEVSEAGRLRAREEGNARLKRLLKAGASSQAQSKSRALK